MDTYGDLDKDCYVEYQAKSKKGLSQQGWKDSHDSVFYRDGVISCASHRALRSSKLTYLGPRRRRRASLRILDFPSGPKF